jgi:protein-disulfide isomerase
VARLLTHWDEIVGPEMARIARPVKVGYGRGSGLGATLTLLARGADAPRLQAEAPKLIARVNAAYGYAAIAASASSRHPKAPALPSPRRLATASPAGPAARMPPRGPPRPASPIRACAPRSKNWAAMCWPAPATDPGHEGALMNRRETLIALGAAAAAAFALPPARAAAEMALGDMAMGDPDAPVEVIEYASFTCSHCATFHTDVAPQLKADYVDTGKVRFIHREVYFDRFGLWAGMIARCGGPDRYFPIADAIYRKQREIFFSSQDPSVVVENLKNVGVAAGLDRAAIEACLQDEAAARALVEAYQKNAEADAIDATPTLIIDGEKHSNMRYSDLARILDARLGG